MNQRVTEDDLLSLIEGELDQASAERIRAEVAADPVLARRVHQMSEQCRMLNEIGQKTGAVRAPALLADEAVAAAEREALMGVSGDQGSLRIARRIGPAPHRRAILAAAAMLVLGVGGWVYFMIRTVGPQGSALQDEPINRPMLAYQPQERDPPKPPPFSAGSGVTNEDRLFAALEGREGELPAELMGPPLPGSRPAPSAVASSSGADANQLLDKWLARLDDETERAGDLNVKQAAAMAMLGRLKIVLEADAPEQARQRLVAFATGHGGQVFAMEDVSRAAVGELPTERRTVPGASADTVPHVSVAFLKSDDASDLVARLTKLQNDMKTAVGGKVRFVESAGRGPAPADSTQPRDLLWWNNPPDQWRTRAYVEIEVDLKRAS